jgi:cytoplasmic iron level regulating protein YaaA (DUF328/UPF0246 family)
MLVVISPSKTQDFESPAPTLEHTQPALLKESEQLMHALRGLSEKRIATLMDISPKLATLNHERYRHFKTPFTPKNAKQAVFAFQGDVYDGLEAATLSAKALQFAQSHLRILSGLYGVLRPFDLIQPYRLEMKTKLANPRGKDLYGFWGDMLTKQLAAEKPKLLVNLASQEYFAAIDPKSLGATVITPQFKEKKAGTYKMIALFAKQARGRMAGYICRGAITTADALHGFAEDGYRYNPTLSEPHSPVFTRG